MKWYTAIGIKINSGKKEFCVQVGEREKVLRGMEIYIWTALLWAFCEQEAVYERMKKLLQITFGENEAKRKICQEEYDFCFRRLCIRGLIVCCESEKMEDAAICLMKAAVLKPSQIRKGEQIKNFWDSLKIGRGLRFSLKAFHKQNLEDNERQLLEKIEKCGNVAMHLETIRSKPCYNWLLPGDPEVLKEFREIMQKEFLADVLALYGKKLVSISYVGREV